MMGVADATQICARNHSVAVLTVVIAWGFRFENPSMISLCLSKIKSRKHETTTNAKGGDDNKDDLNGQ